LVGPGGSAIGLSATGTWAEPLPVLYSNFLKKLLTLGWPAAAAEHRDELVSFNSITSSVRASSVAGTSSPRVRIALI
jgi:hypothetical protein